MHGHEHRFIEKRFSVLNILHGRKKFPRITFWNENCTENGEHSQSFSRHFQLPVSVLSYVIQPRSQDTFCLEISLWYC